MSEATSARTLVVTGTASGIGAATAAAAQSDGQRVIGVDLHDADVCVDLSTVAGRNVLVESVQALSGGSIDAVIACAGVSTSLAVPVNYFGMVATLEGLRPLLTAGSTAPRAVATASFASIMPSDEETVAACLAGDEEHATRRSVEVGNAYESSKTALARWVRRTAPTPPWAGAGIPLNAVSPGTVVTPMTASFRATREGTEILDSMVPMPLNGHAQPEAVAALLLWLASPANTHVTGQNVFIDGGADAVIRGDSIW